MHRMRTTRRGLTLIEMTFALFALSFIGLAIGSMMMAAGNAWETRDDYQNQTQTVRGLSAKLSQWVRQAKRIVSVNTNGDQTDIVLWADDANFAGEVNLAEVRVFSYDRATHELSWHLADLTDREKTDRDANYAIEAQKVGGSSFGPWFRRQGKVDRYVVSEDVQQVAVTLGTTTQGMDFDYLELRLALASPDGQAPQTALVAAGCRAPDRVVAFADDQVPQIGPGGGDDEDEEPTETGPGGFSQDDSGGAGSHGGLGRVISQTARGRGSVPDHVRGRDGDGDRDRGRGRAHGRGW